MLDLMSIYALDPEFSKKLPLIFTQIASQHKALQQGTSIKRIFASILRNILKTLVSLPIWAVAIPFLVSAFYPVYIAFLVLCTSTFAVPFFNIYALAAGVVNFLLLVETPTFILNWGSYLLENLVIPLSNAIDKFVEEIFGVKFSVLSLTELLHQNKTQAAQPAPKTSSFQSSFFSNPKKGEMQQLTYEEVVSSQPLFN